MLNVIIRVSNLAGRAERILTLVFNTQIGCNVRSELFLLSWSGFHYGCLMRDRYGTILHPTERKQAQLQPLARHE